MIEAFERARLWRDFTTEVHEGVRNLLDSLPAQMIDGDKLGGVLDLVRVAEQWSRPYAACPMCNQAGCKTCVGRGWLIQPVYEAVERQMEAGDA